MAREKPPHRDEDDARQELSRNRPASTAADHAQATAHALRQHKTSDHQSSVTEYLEPERNARDWLPDVRDGLTREQRIILTTLYRTQDELGGRSVPTLMLYGRVCEHLSISKERFKALLAQLAGQGRPRS